ncbi:sugar-binding protein [Paenibacillus flagellatus]|nr:sugar-binding protein [Paenibacillus flagellatus]
MTNEPRLRTRRRTAWIALALCAVLLAPLLPPPPQAAADTAATPYFAEHFESAGNSWDGIAWTKETDAAAGSTVGVLTASGAAYPTARAKPASWTDYAATSGSYDYSFRAKYADAASGAPKYARTLFRYNTSSSAANYYYFEFRQAGNAVYFGKYENGTDTRLGGPYAIDGKLAGFDFDVWHDYAIAVHGTRFRLHIDGVFIAESPADAAHTSGTIGFGAKNAALRVDDVVVTPHQDAAAPAIVHTPPAAAAANEPLTVTASIYDESTVTAFVYYGYDGAPATAVGVMTGDAATGYRFDIPGAASGTLQYRIVATDANGLTAASPATGLYTVPVQDAPLAIAHTPIVSVNYNTEASGTFSISDAQATVTAAVYYRIGGESAVYEAAVQRSGGDFAFVIPGTNRASSVSYRIEVRRPSGSVVRYPESGDVTYAVKPFVRYFTDFENDAVGAVPANWTTRGGQPKVQVYDDNGNRILRFANAKDGDNWQAKFVHSQYRNIDNFKVKFKARYVNRNPNPDSVYNLWRIRYRASDATYNTMEWSTHNTKYIMFKRTPLGGYASGSYFRSVPNEWHTYELVVGGVNHKLYMDGTKVVEFDDFAEDAPLQGFFQFDTINGLQLDIDDFEITPLDVPYTFFTQPTGGYAGIFAQGEPVGIDATLRGGSAAHAYTVKYAVAKADGDRSTVSSGERTIQAGAYSTVTETVYFQPNVGALGTYDVTVSLDVDGVPASDQTKKMRIAVVKRMASRTDPDPDFETKYGFNAHYDLTWNEDQLASIADMGVKRLRHEVDWWAIDKGNGVYDYSKLDPIVDKLEQYGMRMMPIIGITSNSIYDPVGTADTPAALEAMGRFVENIAARYKDRIRTWEMPNEPELVMKPYVPQEIVQLQKWFYTSLKKADLDAVLLAGDHTSGVVTHLPPELELGSYDYADAFSYHRYTYGVMPDGFLQNQTNGVKQLVNALGGWKDLYVTESGWPTAKSGFPNVSQEVQRDYAVRGFLIDMITDQLSGLNHFTWKDSGFDDNFFNTSYGITDGDGRPKLAYAALQTLMTTLDRPMYAGKIDTGDASVEAHLFLNGSEPIVAAWKKVNYGSTPVAEAPTSTVSLAVYGAASVTKIDVNGNETTLVPAGGSITVTVGGSPVYLKGFGPDALYASARTLLAEKRADAAAKLQQAGEAAAETVQLDGVHAALDQALTAGGDANARAQAVEQAIADTYALMGAIADRIGAGSLERAEGYVALEALYNYADRAAASLVMAKLEQGLSSVSLDYAASLGAEGTTDPNTARYVYEAKKGESSLLPVSTAAIMRANRYGRLAEQSADASRYAHGYAYNVMAKRFAAAVKRIVASENPIPAGIMASATPLYANMEAGSSASVAVSLSNRTSAAGTATLSLAVPDGWESAQTGPLTAQVPVPAGAVAAHTFAVHAPTGVEKGTYDATVLVTIGGVQTDRIKVRLVVYDAIGAKLQPVDATPAELETVVVRLTGTSPIAKTGQVVLKGPGGVVLAPAAPGGDTFAIAKGQTVDLPFLWNPVAPTPFHEYEVDMTVLDAATNEVIFHDGAIPLDFLVIGKTQTAPVIDGNLQEWSGAHPIHLRGEERNATGLYDPANLDAVAYFQWDDDNLYIAARVTDDVHKAAEPPSNVWRNDSLQISIDPLNDKGTAYKPDDVDFGVALNNLNERLAYVFVAAAPNATGNVSGSLPFAVFRDESSKTTSYEIRIAGSGIVKQLEAALAEGNRIGLNVVANDADLSEGRQNYVQWTRGTADTKNPGQYDSFRFVNGAP